MRPLLIATLLLASTAAWSQIYKTTDEDGNVIFTDSPPADTGDNVESIETGHTNSIPPPEARPDLAPRERSSSSQDTAVSYSVSITNPAEGTTIPMGPGNFSVSASTTPALRDGETLQLIVSGTPWQEPQARGQWNLTDIRRGEHDLVVTRMDSEGAEIAASDAVRILVLRPVRAKN